MKENKNIERLFQEKFKEFEVSPPDIVWENIQEKLQSDKKKRRLLPLWLNVGSIAASFAVLFTLLFLKFLHLSCTVTALQEFLFLLGINMFVHKKNQPIRYIQRIEKQGFQYNLVR